MSVIASRNGIATDAFAITPGAGALPVRPDLGIYVPAGITATAMVCRFGDVSSPLITFTVAGPGVVPICPTYVTAGPAGLVGLR